MNTSAVDQLGDLRVCSVVATKVLDEVEQELSTHHLVAVHVADVLELWLACQDTTQRGFVMGFLFFFILLKALCERAQRTMLMNRGVVRDDHHAELAVVHGAAHRVQVRDGWELAAVLAQEQIHVFVVVVAELLRLDGRVFGWEYGRVGEGGGLDGAGSGAGGGGGGFVV